MKGLENGEMEREFHNWKKTEGVMAVEKSQKGRVIKLTRRIVVLIKNSDLPQHKQKQWRATSFSIVEAVAHFVFVIKGPCGIQQRQWFSSTQMPKLLLSWKNNGGPLGIQQQ